MGATTVRARLGGLLGAVSVLGLAMVAAYACLRLALTVTGSYGIADRLFAVLLLGADLFLCVHGFGFFLVVWKATTAPPGVSTFFGAHAPVPVALLVAAFNESEDVLEETLASVAALDYPLLRVYLVDDSTRAECREGSARLAARYGATLVHRANRAGYKAGAINDLLPTLTEPYVALLDADQRPLTSWLREVVAAMEKDPSLALLQCPQVYANLEGLPVARTARFQQAVFFEYICEGKSSSNAMFCCGSNVVLRRSALLAIETVVDGRRNFLDETSVTEDLATTLRLHLAGWRTAYLNRTHVVGMGPETMAAYHTQQMRWAMGTLAIGLRLLRRFVREPRALSPAQWWEYLLSGSYYLVGLANLVFLTAPAAFVLFDVRPLHADPRLYFLLFMPYVLGSLAFLFLAMRRRGYPLRDVWLATALTFVTFWTYVKAALVALLGLKRAFGVTPKGVGGALPLSALRVELAMLVLNAGAALAGVIQMARGAHDVAHLANTFWATYHALLLSTLFLYFNRRVEVAARPRLFAPPLQAVRP